MAQLNIPTIAPVLNQMQSDLQKQFENQDTTYRKIYKRGVKDFVNGKGECIPSQFTRPTGITAFTEGGSFNTPNNPLYADMYVYPTAYAMPYDLSGRTIRNFNAGSEYSQIAGLAGYMAVVSEALVKDMERNFWGDGSGKRAHFTSASGTTFTVTSAAAATFGSTKGSKWMEVNETYDVITSAGAVRGQTRVATVPTATTFTGTLVGFAAGDIASTDIAVPQGGYLNFPKGFAYIINNDTGVFQLLSRSTYPQLKSSVVDLAGASVTVSDFNQAVGFLQVRGDSLGPQTGASAWMPVAQEAALLRLGQNLKRFAGTDQKFDGGYQTFGYGNLKIEVALDIDEDRIYFTRDEDLFIVEEMPFGAYDLDGNQLRMKLGTNGVGSDSYVGAIGAQFNLGCYQPRKHTLIKRAAITGLPTQVNAG